MGVAQIAALVAGFGVFGAVMVAAMRDGLRPEDEHMARRRRARIDRGADPDEEPKFELGHSG